MVGILHIGRRVERANLQVGFLNQRLLLRLRRGPVREHGCYCTGRTTRAGTHADRKKLVRGELGLDLGGTLEASNGGGDVGRATGGVPDGAHHHVGLPVSVRVRRAVDVDVVERVGHWHCGIVEVADV